MTAHCPNPTQDLFKYFIIQTRQIEKERPYNEGILGVSPKQVILYWINIDQKVRKNHPLRNIHKVVDTCGGKGNDSIL